MTFDEEEYKQRKKEFEREYNRIEPYESRRKLSNSSKRKEYKECIVRTYNKIVHYIEPAFHDADVDNRLDIQNKLIGHLSKFKNALKILKLNYEFGRNPFEIIDLEKIIEDTEEVIIDDNESDDTDINSENTVESVINAQQYTIFTSQAQNKNMPQTKEEFIATANRTINFRYKGDPLTLDSFIDAIELLKDLCEEQNLSTFFKFVRTRLDGFARLAISTNASTVDDIINDLKASIKTDSSKVIEGRMLALRADKSSLTKFAEVAEQLAEQFRRSLCVEGFSKEKAKELSVEKTIELCRKSTKSERVKSIIAASAFSEPKEVIAKMIVEINNLKQDQPHNSYTHKYNNQNKNYNNQNKSYGNKNTNFHDRNANKGNVQNNRHNNDNNGNNFKSNFNRSGQNNYSSYNGRSSGYNKNQSRSNDQPIRLVSGNETHPGNSGQTLNQ